MDHQSGKAEPQRTVCQTGVVPFRRSQTAIEFCLITGRRSRRWGFPKGRIGEKTSLQDAALSEAWEEAGLSGIIVGPPLGQYDYRKKGKEHQVVTWLMQVHASSPTWKESAERSRQWVSLDRGFVLIDRPRLAELLALAVKRIADVGPMPAVLFPSLDVSQIAEFRRSSSQN